MKIIDTDVMSSLQRKRIDPRLQGWIGRQEARELAIAAPTIAEIRYGQASLPEGSALAAGLEEWLRGLHAIWPVLPLDAVAADHLGRMWAMPRLRNFILPQPGQRKLKTGGDLMIAAIGLANDAAIATGNAANFAQIAACFPALRVENPFI